MLTPSSDRDSKWSTPEASVKKRSSGSVMAVSLSCGGMPEKNVATTTSGKLMGGKRSTGIRDKLVTPITTSTRQITITKYGLRIENPAIKFVRLRLRRGRDARSAAYCGFYSWYCHNATCCG